MWISRNTKKTRNFFGIFKRTTAANLAKKIFGFLCTPGLATFCAFWLLYELATNSRERHRFVAATEQQQQHNSTTGGGSDTTITAQAAAAAHNNSSSTGGVNDTIITAARGELEEEAAASTTQ